MARMGPSSEDPSGVRSDDPSEEGRPPDDRDPDREMEALMSTPASPAEAASDAAPAATASVSREDAEIDAAQRQARDPESEMAALMGNADATPDPSHGAPHLDQEMRRVASPSHTRRRAVGSDDEFEADARTIVRIRRPIDENAPARERVPVKQRVVAPQLPPALRRHREAREKQPPSLLWAVVAGVGIAGAIVVVQRVMAPDPPSPVATKTAREPAGEMPRVRESTNARTQPTPTEDAAAVEPPVVPPTADAPAQPAPKAALEPVPVAPKAPEPPAAAKPAAPERASANPRTPPPGTPAETAAIFAKLPVSPADLPPVGGIGRSGIHVDRIEMGSAYEKGLCAGLPDKFSLAKLERVNVCLRVVHLREEEVVSIVWQKNDLGTARRGKIAIKPMHAYRTRAYLVLRKEYVGDWTVRIMSSEGVELAAHRFTIVP
jgi:hypothetical protein